MDMIRGYTLNVSKNLNAKRLFIVQKFGNFKIASQNYTWEEPNRKMTKIRIAFFIPGRLVISNSVCGETNYTAMFVYSCSY